MIALDILSDGFFAAIAGIGFGAISDPPLRAFKMIAILAALGHACRFCLMTYLGVDIATASLFGGLVIGFGSLWLGKRVYCPMTVLYIPALLPMIPGKFAYNMVFSLIMCLQTANKPELLQHFGGKYSNFHACSRSYIPDVPVPAQSLFFNKTLIKLLLWRFFGEQLRIIIQPPGFCRLLSF